MKRPWSIVRIALIPQALLCILCFTGSARAEANYDVLDQNGVRIFSIKSDGFSYVGAGVYETRALDGSVKFLNKNGGSVHSVVPEDCKVGAIYIYGSDSSKAVEKLPSDALIEISKVGLHGLIDGDGRTVLPMLYDKIRYLGPHTRLVTKFNREKDLAETFVFSTQMRKLSSTPIDLEQQINIESDGLLIFSQTVRDGHFPAWRSGYMNEDNVVIIPAVYTMPGNFCDGLAIVRPLNSADDSILINRKGENVCPEIIPRSIFLDDVAIATTVKSKPLLGLIDRNFHFVVAPSYFNITPVAKNLFASKKRDSDPFDITNEKGKKLFTLPDKVTELEYRDKDSSGLIIGKIKPPAQTLDCRTGDTIAAFDASGKMLLEFDGWVSARKNGLIVLAKSVHKEILSGIVDASGKWLIQPKDSRFVLAESDRIIEETNVNKFDSAAFKRGRSEQFAKFLEDFDFIGMPRLQVANLLGEQDEMRDRDKFTMSHPMCGTSWKQLEVEYVEDKVKRWRFISDEGKGEYVDTNMIFDPDAPAGQEKLVKKASSL